MGVFAIVFMIIVLLCMVLCILNIKLVSQSEKWVIERLGVYNTTWSAGLHMLIPFIDRIVMKTTTKEIVLDYPPQPVITKDNVTINIDTVIYAKVTDAKLYTYGNAQPMTAIENLTATTLRNIIGEYELDATLTSRDEVNAKMRAMLDEATDPWGIKVIRVEIKTIQPPKDIQDAMERQMKAERDKRAKILEADGIRESKIRIAEGDKTAKILNAEADKEAKVLQAKAEKEKMILEAEGKAKALLDVQEAESRALTLLTNANPSKEIITLKGYDAIKEMANGSANKILLPCDFANLGGLMAGLKECASTSTGKKKGNTNKSSRSNPKNDSPGFDEISLI